MNIKSIAIGVSAFLLTLALMGGVITGGSVAPGNTSETIMTIRHAATGAAGTVRLVGPNGLYVLAAKVGNNWGFVALTGTKDALWSWAALGKAANMVSPLSWSNLYADLLANGYQEITAAQLPAGIKNIAGVPQFDSFIRWFVAALNGAGCAGAAKKLGRRAK